VLATALPGAHERLARPATRRVLAGALAAFAIGYVIARAAAAAGALGRG